MGLIVASRSFNYGADPGRTQNGTGSFIQLLSTTERDAAWADFAQSRVETLMTVPNNIDPLVLQQFPGALANLAQQFTGLAPAPNGDSGDSSAGAEAASGRVLGAVSSSSDSSSVSSLLDKYGPIVIGLLAANVLVSHETPGLKRFA